MSDFPDDDTDLFDFFFTDGKASSNEAAGSAQDQQALETGQFGISNGYQQVLQDIQGIDNQQPFHLGRLNGGDVCPIDQHSTAPFDKAISDAHCGAMVPDQAPPHQEERVQIRTGQPETLAVVDDGLQELQQGNGFSGQQQTTDNGQFDSCHSNGPLQQVIGSDKQKASNMTHSGIGDDSQPVRHENGLVAPSDKASDKAKTVSKVRVPEPAPELRLGRFVIRRQAPTTKAKLTVRTASEQNRGQPTNTPPQQKKADVVTAGNTPYYDQQHRQGSTIQTLGFTVPDVAGSSTMQLPNEDPISSSWPVVPPREHHLHGTPGFQPHHQRNTQATLAQINHDAHSGVMDPFRPALSNSKMGLLPVRTMNRHTSANSAGDGYGQHQNEYMGHTGSGIDLYSRPQENREHGQHVRQTPNINQFDVGYGDQAIQQDNGLHNPASFGQTRQDAENGAAVPFRPAPSFPPMERPVLRANEPQALTPKAGPGIRWNLNRNNEQSTSSQLPYQSQTNGFDTEIIPYSGQQAPNGQQCSFEPNQEASFGQTSQDAHRASEQETLAPKAGPGIRWNLNRNNEQSTSSQLPYQSQTNGFDTEIIPYSGQQAPNGQQCSFEPNQEASFGQTSQDAHRASEQETLARKAGPGICWNSNRNNEQSTSAQLPYQSQSNGFDAEIIPYSGQQAPNGQQYSFEPNQEASFGQTSQDAHRANEHEALAWKAGPGIRWNSNRNNEQSISARLPFQSQSNGFDAEIIPYSGQQAPNGQQCSFEPNQEASFGQTGQDVHRASEQETSARKAGPGIRWNSNRNKGQSGSQTLNEMTHPEILPHVDNLPDFSQGKITNNVSQNKSNLDPFSDGFNKDHGLSDMASINEYLESDSGKRRFRYDDSFDTSENGNDEQLNLNISFDQPENSSSTELDSNVVFDRFQQGKGSIDNDQLRRDSKMSQYGFNKAPFGQKNRDGPSGVPMVPYRPDSFDSGVRCLPSHTNPDTLTSDGLDMQQDYDNERQHAAVRNAAPTLNEGFVQQYGFEAKESNQDLIVCQDTFGDHFRSHQQENRLYDQQVQQVLDDNQFDNEVLLESSSSGTRNRCMPIPYNENPSSARTVAAHRGQNTAARAAPDVLCEKNGHVKNRQHPYQRSSNAAQDRIIPYGGQQHTPETMNPVRYAVPPIPGESRNQSIAMRMTAPSLHNGGRIPFREQNKRQIPGMDHFDASSQPAHNGVMDPFRTSSGTRIGHSVNAAPQAQPSQSRNGPVVHLSTEQDRRQSTSSQSQAHTHSDLYYNQQHRPETLQFSMPVTGAATNHQASTRHLNTSSSSRPGLPWRDRLVPEGSLHGDPTRFAVSSHAVPYYGAAKNKYMSAAGVRKTCPYEIRREAERQRKLATGLYKFVNNRVLPKTRAELTSAQFEELQIEKRKTKASRGD